MLGKLRITSHYVLQTTEANCTASFDNLAICQHEQRFDNPWPKRVNRKVNQEKSQKLPVKN